MNTHESYVSLETAKMLREVGFDWPVMHFYDEFEDGKIPFYSRGAEELQQNMNAFGYYSAPTLAVAQRWLRENKDFDINVLTDFDSVKRLYYVRYVVKDGHYKTYYISNNRSYVYFNTYEEAQEAGILKCLTLILEKDDSK